MHKTKTELYEFITDLKTKQDFEKEIKTRYKTYDELLDKDTIALLIVDELGRNTHSTTKISQLSPDCDSTVIGKVLSISESKAFKRKNGTPGKVINLDICDETGRCKLVLWNGDTDLIKNKEIMPGTTVKIINGYTKQGYAGLEINLGRWGLLEVIPADTKDQPGATTCPGEITGMLIHKEPTRAFFKDDGEFRFVTTITVKEHNKETQITLWDHHVKDIQSFNIGDSITLKQVTTKHNNGTIEYHVNGNSTIQKHM
jgi:replication factor A1